MIENNKKYQDLVRSMEQYAKLNVAVAFSGGVDSSLLLKIACECAKKYKTKVYAITAMTKLHPMSDLQITRQVVAQTTAIHEIVTIDELEEAGIADNPVDRCYRCKKSIFQKICSFAKLNNISYVIEGTNADDLKVYRPGIKALHELGIISPLADAGITKEEIRSFAKELEVCVFDRPSTPCLATRIPYGDHLDYELMRKIAKGEAFLREKGFYNVRIRIHKTITRIEVDENELLRLLEEREEIINYLHSLGFVYITMDLEGFRSGSMDYFLK